MEQHVCGFYFLERAARDARTYYGGSGYGPPRRRYLPQVSLSAHATIVASSSRTTLTQTFVNPLTDKAIPELRYAFPLYDGVSVVGFVCTINKDRVITGVVREKQKARQVYEAAVRRGETAGLLEQLPEAADVFTTTVGNVPAGAEIRVEITYLGELKHDAEVDGTRFTIPTRIAPRYGDYPGELVRRPSHVPAAGGIDIVVDAEMPAGSNIKAVRSPSHPIAVSIGSTSRAASGDEPSLRKASATLALGTAELDRDFVVQVVATNAGNPVAVLETHPTIPSQRALMATLVPKFSLPPSRPEIVFVCDRSGSMASGGKIPNLKSALQIFLKSLPVGVKFNICSFGSRHSFLFPDGSRSYDQSSLDEATRHIETFSANYGGTEMYAPLEATFRKRYKDMDLEVFVLTDGEIWDQERLFAMVNEQAGAGSGGPVRVFTLGVGADVSHALIEGLARSGNGFAQTVAEGEKMGSKVVRMLKAALSPHVADYALEVKYGDAEHPDEDFDMVEKVDDGPAADVAGPEAAAGKKPISLFDTSADADADAADAGAGDADNKFSHVPAVDVPKLLQAPFRIPPLFPFSRSTVYLLLSPDTNQNVPKSVVLRGTSRHGPLELEIPVTVLEKRDSTIHQLAARKAVKELEEGRGWIRHAKDRDGKLLKDKYEGRFPDMVEREAVRLGTQYQVAGKWCSFVAVEARGELAPTPDQRRAGGPSSSSDVSERASRRSQSCRRSSVATASSADYLADSGALDAASGTWTPGTADFEMPDLEEASFGGMLPQPPPPPPRIAMAHYQMMAGAVPQSLMMAAAPRQQSQMMAAPMQAQAMAAQAQQAAQMRSASQSGGLASSARAKVRKSKASRSSASFDAPIARPDSNPRRSAPSSRAVLDSSLSADARKRAPSETAPALEAQSAGVLPGAPRDPYYGRGGFGAPAADSAPDAYGAPAGYSASVAYGAPAGYSASMAYGAPQTEAAVPGFAQLERAVDTGKGALDALVQWQTFEGYWRWTDALVGLLGVGGDAVQKAFADNRSSAAPKSDAAATAMVIAFLRKRKADDKEEWEMLVEKALAWLEGRGGYAAEDLVAAAAVLF